ncbi:MAG: TraR/DksA C4-type zinc finger protein [Paracoccus sp. (in: a-proteobacteria)]|uniref:TraR/DksA family transcriptional regulator n=1 Tax=Paracoccus sp. TaxID=267 RepID=UPI0026DF15C4|nr:TraR/DksA C4-type zinc finger protein [Paracoccus sp. (in: a-proteobacteria)]MDO5612847.1 TraR/DksA C4-type zinc finger protein [Paracoccus sp. (in: a-proteobacteria)]
MTPEAARKLLTARRRELLSNLNEIEDRLDETPPADWEERAVERQDDEVLQALGHQEQAEVRRIDAALDRIAEGEYGACTKCGNDIAAARLELLPDTPFCAACAP